MTASELHIWHRGAEVALSARDFRRAHELCLCILRREPQFADAYFLLGMIAAEHANFRKALDVIDRALCIAPDRSDYHAQRARCLLALSEPAAASDAAMQALELRPSDALTFDTIGVVLTRTGSQMEAVEPLRQAVALDPHKPAYHYNLAAALQFVGDFQGAEAAYRTTLRLDHKHHRAWSALAQLRRAALAPEDVAHLQDLLAHATLDRDAQLHLRHALAKHYEDENQFAASFSELEQGRRCKRQALQYDFATDHALFTAARKLCTPEFWTGRSGCDSAEPIFVLGMPRTGTTLVERILSSHPDVFAAGELTNFALVVKRAAATPSPYVLDVGTFAAAGALDFAAIGRSYIDSTRPRTGATQHFIDKMPLNFFYAGLIHRCLPQARIICLRRNALDTCLSNYRQLFATSFSYYNYAFDLLDTGRYYQQFDALIHYWREVIPPQSFMEVHYEDLVTETEREARRLLDFCGLDFRSEVLDFHENAAPVSTASSVQVRRPVYRTAVERWRRYEAQLQPLMELLRNSPDGTIRTRTSY